MTTWPQPAWSTRVDLKCGKNSLSVRRIAQRDEWSHRLGRQCFRREPRKVP
jgi:hypothetical protein